MTLYYALEGRSPFRAETLPATIAAILSKNLAEPRTRGEVAAVVLRMLRKHPAERPDAATVAAVLRRVAANGGQTARPSWQAARAARDSPAPWTAGAAQTVRAPEPAARAAQPAERAAQYPARQTAVPLARSPLRLTPLQGMPALDAAKIVSDWPTDRAVTDLLTLGGTAAAGIINRCEDAVAGKLLSGIAAGKPARARKILEMVTTERAGRLLDHMSSTRRRVRAVPSHAHRGGAGARSGRRPDRYRGAA